jgi:hypothetical protein
MQGSGCNENQVRNTKEVSPEGIEWARSFAVRSQSKCIARSSASHIRGPLRCHFPKSVFIPDGLSLGEREQGRDYVCTE